MASHANVAPQADATAPQAPEQPAQQQAPAPPLQPAPPVTGAVQPTPAPPPTRSRNPRGPLPPQSTGTSGPGIPALLEVGAATPFSTVFHRAQNYFVPVAIHLFHLLGIMDNTMGSTHRFQQSAPMWIPIVSHYYIAVLWIYQILSVRVETGYADATQIEFVDQLKRFLHIDDCLIPGPLVPFFSSLAASSSAFDWLGDIIPGLPNVTDMIDPNNGSIDQHWMRSVPFPAAIIDQLIYWTIFTPTGTNTRYGEFEWYRNVFEQTDNYSAHFRLAPNTAGSLYVTDAQHTQAHIRWLAALGTATAPIFRRVPLVNVVAYDNFFQFCGFQDGNGHMSTDVFTHVALTMQSYCMYFSGSVPLRTISPTGLGAGIPRGIPTGSIAIRDWLYPASRPSARRSGYLPAIHPIPGRFSAHFEHSDHELEEVAEQYALTTHINVDLAHTNNGTQHGYQRPTNNVSGILWTMTNFRQTGQVTVHAAYGMTVASRYHHSTAIRPT